MKASSYVAFHMIRSGRTDGHPDGKAVGTPVKFLEASGRAQPWWDGVPMSEFAEENLAALVRQMMPSRRIDWIVQVTDNHEEACALFNRNVLRVHRLWKSDIYDAGLHLLPMHHLLSARRVGSEILRGIASRIAVDVWEARFIKNHKGRLTEKHGYLARTPDREHVAFGGCAATAELGVLRELRSAISKRARLARERARRIEDYQEFLRSRSVRR